MIFGGGVPFGINGEHLGGIGCSSGTVDEDTIVVQAGIDALEAALSGE